MTVAAVSAPKRRKTRTRKVAKTTTKVQPKVTQTVTKVQSKVVIESPKMDKPEATLITRQQYVQDVKNRWAIHTFETQELWKDMVKGYNFLTPYFKKSVNYVRESYDRAFNTTPENTEVK
jgi:hypothetical protein|tara:strand:+ start:1596 stop:1955 length:360 start_codon:yes stop_codon:yes gene_type:complete